MGNKTIVGFGIGVVLFIMIFGSLVIFETNAESNEPEIDENQVDDEISRTITVHLEDGITSSDDIK